MELLFTIMSKIDPEYPVHEWAVERTAQKVLCPYFTFHFTSVARH